MSTDISPAEFTIELLEWSPWIERATETDLPDDLREQVEAHVGTAPNSSYINVLANDFAALRARALVHHHIFTSKEPQPTSYRELGATTTSRINGCIFCASVHARIWAHESGNRELALAFLKDGVDTDLPSPEREIVDVAARLTTDPESLTAEHLQPLRDLGFDDWAILDVLNYAGFFANANRLMLTLGEPFFRRAPANGAGS